MKKILPIFVLCMVNASFAQRTVSQELYEGSVSGNLNVSLYLKIEENGCPRTVASAIYKYNAHKENNWILLETTFSEEKQQYTFVEHHNTGILLLSRTRERLTGLWISADGRKQLPVHLTKVKAGPDQMEKLEDALERAQYNAYDC